MFHFGRKHRRAAWRKEGLSGTQRAVIAKNVPYFSRLTEEDREELLSLVRVFLEEKSFEGCGGLEMTEEIKLTIAAHACILLLHRDNDMYPGVDSILVYPGAYRVHATAREGGVLIEADQTRLGESWTRGLVVLAWDHVKLHAGQHPDGQNVVLHEFAHQLDSEDGAMDGAPDLGTRARYTSWAHVLGDELGARSDIDPYGATNPAEFFAVVTEMFFEKPAALKKRHPGIYGELRSFYQQDPAACEAVAPLVLETAE
jgi:Mlc titration factor MtfA (ptsG expression regulator)